MSNQAEAAVKNQIELAVPRFVSAEPRHIAGLLAHHDAGNSAGIPTQWRRFVACMSQLSGRLGDASFGVVLGAPGVDGIDYLTGVEVKADAVLPAGFSRVKLPGGHYVLFEHSGHLSTLCLTCAAIFERWLPQSGCALAGDTPFFERYDAAFDPQTGLGVIEIWLAVTAK